MTEQNKITINETEYDFADLDEQSQYFVNQVRNLERSHCRGTVQY